MKEGTPKRPNGLVVVSGVGIGEETKGATVDWLTEKLKAHTVIRSGSCSAGHHVVTDDGREFEFSHFGSGTFHGAQTHLEQMVIFPAYLFEEAMELEEVGVENPLEMITISQNCLVLTPFHGAYGQLKEISRGPDKKGTIGLGVSDAIRDSKENPELTIRAGEFLGDQALLSQKVEAIRQYKLQQARELLATVSGLSSLAEVQERLDLLENKSLVPLVVQSFLYLADLVQIVDDEYLDKILKREGTIICEPDHGALHHPWYGFAPHTSEVDPTAQDVLEIIRQHEHNKKVTRLGASRCYVPRLGAGPLPSFSRELTDQIGETHNLTDSEWLGEFRNGYYDPILIQYAINFTGEKEAFDGLVISHLDVLAKYKEWPVVEAYLYEGEPVDDLDQFFELKDGQIVGIKVYPNTRDEAHYQHQLRLTKLIKECKPVLKTLRPDNGKTLEEVFLDYVEEKLGLPVVAVSRGPKAKDKETREDWQHLFAEKTT